MNWKLNQLVWITSDLSLGPARIVADEDDSFFRVQFLNDQSHRQFSKKHPPFRRVEIRKDQRLTMKDGESVVVEKIISESPLYRFESDLGSYDESEIKELANDFGVADLLEHQHFTPLRSFLLRKQGLELHSARENHRYKGISGCRVDLMEHQIWLALNSTEISAESPLIRCLLADEVGLGKTIEAGLIFSRLLAMNQLKRVIVLVPEALKVQWLTELYRRFNIRFRLDHEEMIEEDDYCDFVISSFDRALTLTDSPDLIIVDEAHRILGHEHFDKISELIKSSRHALLLTATPLVQGSTGLSKMIDLLRLSKNKNINPKIFASKRSDVAIQTWRSVEPLFVRSTKEWIAKELKSQIDPAVPLRRREKIFLITSTANQVGELQKYLVQQIGQKIACFHEGMDLIERDRQAAYFADPEGAQFLIASEIGGEGRNFQFASRMILCDLPKDPAVLEQRIGRLDRIGQRKKVIVQCPIEENTDDEFMFELHRDVFETFERPWTGASLRDSSDFQKQFDLAFSSRSLPDLAALKNSLAASPVDLKQLETKLGFELLQYHSKNPATLPDLKSLNQIEVRGFLEELYELFGVEVEDFDSFGSLKISASSLMFVDYFPGLGVDGEKVLTFDRNLALVREDFSFFSIDHPEFQESVDLLLASDNGRLALAKFNADSLQPRDLQLLMVFRDSDLSLNQFYHYSYSQKKSARIKDLGWFKNLESVDHKRLPPDFLRQLSEQFKSIFLQVMQDPSLENSYLDSLLVLIPS